MSPKCKPFKDVLAAPGSELYQALVDRDQKKAEKLYKECLAREKSREEKTTATKESHQDGTL
jgi:hypothetical protein